MTVPPTNNPARIAALGFHFPGSPLRIDGLPLSPEETGRLPRLGQVITHIADEDSTALMVHAARDVLARHGGTASDIRMVISAPSLVTSYGLEIPAVAVRAELGLTNAQCLNLAQGCVGVLRGIDLAAQLVNAQPEGGDIMVVTSCRASSHTRNMNHGAFFWGDGAAAVIVSAKDKTGVEIAGYAEASNDANWGAMRIGLGDAMEAASADDINRISVHFATPEDQIDYIRAEQRHFATVTNTLLDRQGLHEDDIDAVFLPSTGKNRIPILFSEHRGLLKKVGTDFSYAHFGGVDPILSISQHLEQGAGRPGGWLLLISPAFTAQWGGLLLRKPD